MDFRKFIINVRYPRSVGPASKAALTSLYTAGRRFSSARSIMEARLMRIREMENPYTIFFALKEGKLIR
jgi:hypothetical protein